MGSDLPRNADSFSSILVVENEEIRTTSFASCNQIDGLPYVNVPENRVSVSDDDLFHHQLNGSFVELEPKFTDFCYENVSKTSDSVQNPNYFFVKSCCKMALSSPTACNNGEQCQKSSHMQSLKHSFAGKKRKMVSENKSQLPDSKNMSNTRKKNELAEKQDEEEKLELEQKSVAKSCIEIAGNECMHNSNGEAAPNAIFLPTEASKEDRLQLGEKRGHATGKHNLAERIRRERINERMKFLQGLVPGCDKITGKAVMLDEIINYILSLQHQVEFLSTKLDAVNFREKSQLDQFLTEDIYHSPGITEAPRDNHEARSFHSLPNNYAALTPPMNLNMSREDP